MSDEKKKEDLPGRSLSELTDDMTKKCGLLSDLEEASRRAGKNITDCWTSINSLQNLIEGQVEKMKNVAPYESNWGKERRRGKNE